VTDEWTEGQRDGRTHRLLYIQVRNMKFAKQYEENNVLVRYFICDVLLLILLFFFNLNDFGVPLSQT
jgi:hypothetical protein